jgi:regulator of sigma E protease
LSTVISILAGLLILSLFVMLHELGHYGAGRLLGFDIVEFSIGMGPAILKKKRNGILYALRAFPVGGMCRFYGEDEETGDGKAFGSHPVWKRMIVLVAGAAMNILTALILAVVMLMAYGNFMPSVHSFTEENAPAKLAGMVEGDRIVAVNGHKLSYYADLTTYIGKTNGESMTITVERNGETLELTVKDFYNETEGKNLIGIMMEPVRMKQGFFGAIGGSFRYIGQMVKDMVGFFGMLFQGQAGISDMGGPVAIVTIFGQAVRTGFEAVLQLGVIISANLGLFNLLPLPALDGGRFVFLVVELIRGKPVSPEKEGLVHFVGIILLLILVVVISISDVSKLFGGGYGM